MYGEEEDKEEVGTYMRFVLSNLYASNTKIYKRTYSLNIIQHVPLGKYENYYVLLFKTYSLTSNEYYYDDEHAKERTYERIVYYMVMRANAGTRE